MDQQQIDLARKIFDLSNAINYVNRAGIRVNDSTRNAHLKKFFTRYGVIGTQRQGETIGISRKKFLALVRDIYKHLISSQIVETNANAANILLLSATTQMDSDTAAMYNMLTEEYEYVTIRYNDFDYNVPADFYQNGVLVDDVIERIAVLVLTELNLIGSFDSDIIIGGNYIPSVERTIKQLGISPNRSAKNVEYVQQPLTPPPPIQPVQVTEPNKVDQNTLDFQAAIEGDITTRGGNPVDPNEEELNKMADLLTGVSQERPKAEPEFIKTHQTLEQISVNVEDVLVADPEQVLEAVMDPDRLVDMIADMLLDVPITEIEIIFETLAIQVPRFIRTGLSLTGVSSLPLPFAQSSGDPYFGRPDEPELPDGPPQSPPEIIQDAVRSYHRAGELDKPRFQKIIKDNVKNYVQQNSNSIFSGEFYSRMRGYLSVLMSYDRGVNNILAEPIRANIISQDAIVEVMNEMVNSLDTMATVTSITLGLTTSGIILSVFYAVLSRILFYTGYGSSQFRQPIPFNVEKFRIITDKTGKVLSKTIVTDDANFYPESISDQDVFRIVTNPSGYTISKILPGNVQTDILSSNFNYSLYNYIGNHMLSISDYNLEPTFLQPSYVLKESVIEGIDDMLNNILQGDKESSMYELTKFLPVFEDFMKNNRQVIVNLVKQPALGRGKSNISGGGGDPEEDDGDFYESDFKIPDKKLNNDGGYAKTEEGQWYIIKTLIYWLMKNIYGYYELTSEHMRMLFSICYDLAISMFKSIIGNHPYIFTTVSAVALLKPELIPEVFNTLVFFTESMLTIINKTFSFISSNFGLLLLGVGAGLLLWNYSRSGTKISVF
jgi:hypothetical protein